MASISSPFPLSSTPLSQKAHVSAVINSTDEAVVAADGEGLSIHHIAPNRVVSAYSVGPDVKFLSAPLSVRRSTEESVTWVVYERKGDIKLLCWTQKGVDCTTSTIALQPKKQSITSLLSIDETGESILVNYQNTQLECHTNGEKAVRWTWNISPEPKLLKMFKASECPLTSKLQGYVICTISKNASFYSLSTKKAPVQPSVSLQLEPTKAASFAFHPPSVSLVELVEKSVVVSQQDNPPISHPLSEKFDQVYPLSASHILLVSHQKLIIFDIVYGTIQASHSVPNSFHSIIPASDPLSFHAIITSENQPLFITLTIPEKATLIDALGKGPRLDLHTDTPPLFLGTKIQMGRKNVDDAVKQLFSKLKGASDGTEFDKIFKDFRMEFKVNRVEDNPSIPNKRHKDQKRYTRLSTAFVRELLGVMFLREDEIPKFRVYPEQVIKFLLLGKYFSRDLLPGGAEGLVSAALGNKKFFKKLLEKEPTPFTYRDYVLLVKYILDTPEDKTIVSSTTILDSFERVANSFFERPALKTILSTDQLHQFLGVLTRDPENIAYPNLLAAVLDSIGLGPLLLTQSLPIDLIESLHSTLNAETEDISACLETSAMLNLILRRQKDIPDSRSSERRFLHHGTKRKLGEAGWIDIVAEENGMTRQQKLWMKKAPLPGKKLTHRFVATTKFQEAPTYSLDRMIL